MRERIRAILCSHSLIQKYRRRCDDVIVRLQHTERFSLCVSAAPHQVNKLCFVHERKEKKGARKILKLTLSLLIFIYFFF